MYTFETFNCLDHQVVIVLLSSLFVIGRHLLNNSFLGVTC